LFTAGRLGPILFQLAPGFEADPERLERFLEGVPRAVRAAFEFRNASWFDERTYDVLRKRNAALCLAENEKLETPHVITADFVYLRLRKPDYSEAELTDINSRVQSYLAAGHSTFAIFKHEESPAGAMNAEKLLERQSGR